MPDRTAADRAIASALVTAQVGLLALLVVLPRRGDWPTPPRLRAAARTGQLAGVALAAAAARGLGPGLTASPLPNPAATLRTGGLYRRVRHPVYSGVLLAAAARTAGSGNRYDAAVLAALVALLAGKARFEERHLARRFVDYPAYAARTPRFLPWRRPAILAKGYWPVA